MLVAARKLNPRFLSGKTGWQVQVAANYPLNWGLGSSATLQFLVARWANIPEFEFFRMISQGSGYDIVCAGQSGLLHFQLRKGCPEISPAAPGPALRNHTFYVPLGKKQQSKKEVAAFLEGMNFSEIDLVAVSQLSEAICETASPVELIRLVNEHEYILSTILKKDPLALRFPDFPGTAKSLGAWGGDFAMFVSAAEPKEVIKILRSSGFSKVFSYSDLEIKA
jgi:mevalonate kinase